MPKKDNKKKNIPLIVLIIGFALLLITYGAIAVLNNIAEQTENLVDNLIVDFIIRPLFEEANTINIIIEGFNILVVIFGLILIIFGIKKGKNK